MNKFARWWKRSAEYRLRFGLIPGLLVAWQMGNVEYRRPKGEVIAVRVPGWQHPLSMRAGSADSLVFRQVVVLRELEFPLDPPPRTIIDGGANIGVSARVFAERWPEARIVSVELSRANAELLKQNCAAFPQVTVINAALWSEAGFVGISDPGADEHMFQATTTTDNATGAVPAFGIDDLLREVGWDQVDLLKLDIEGAEREVLSTASRWLPKVKHLVVELHDRFAPGCTEAFRAALADGAWDVREHGEYMIASRRGPDTGKDRPA